MIASNTDFGSGTFCNLWPETDSSMNLSVSIIHCAIVRSMSSLFIESFLLINFTDLFSHLRRAISSSRLGFMPAKSMANN